MNEGAGKNLDWFWKSWFYDAGTVDLAIKELTHEENSYKLVIQNKGGKPLPVHLSIYFKDGSIARRQYSVAVWENRQPEWSLSISDDKPILKVILGDTYIPDHDKRNNEYIVN